MRIPLSCLLVLVSLAACSRDPAVACAADNNHCSEYRAISREGARTIAKACLDAKQTLLLRCGRQGLAGTCTVAEPDAGVRTDYSYDADTGTADACRAASGTWQTNDTDSNSTS